MRLGSVSQQSGERKSYVFNYAEALGGGFVRQVLQCTAEPSDLMVDPLLLSEHRVRIFVSGGISGTTYTITTRVETGDGEILEDELVCRVKDI